MEAFIRLDAKAAPLPLANIDTDQIIPKQFLKTVEREGLVEIGASLKEPAADKPDRFGGLAWRVTDPDAAQARIAAAGFDVSEVRTGRKPGTKVFTVRNAPAGVPTIMLSAEPKLETV